MQYDENAEKYGYDGEMTPMKCDELTRKYSDITGPFYNASEVDAAIAELKAALEDVKATAYTESVDAGMRERRLRRALWLARAERAEAEHAHWATIWFCNNKISLNINKSSISQDPYKSNTFRNASEWRNMWYDIASKCLKKAEEYK